MAINAFQQSEEQALESEKRLGADGFMTVEQAHRLFVCGMSTLWDWIAKGRVPATRIGGKWMIPLSYLRELEERAYARRNVALCASERAKRRKSATKKKKPKDEVPGA